MKRRSFIVGVLQAGIALSLRAQAAKPLGRFLVFWWETQPLGGWLDFGLDFNKASEAAAYLAQFPPSYCGHIVDTATMTVSASRSAQSFPTIAPGAHRDFVFAFALNAPQGGWADCIGSMPQAGTANALLAAAIVGSIDTGHVIDTISGWCVKKVGPGPALGSGRPVIYFPSAINGG